MHIADMTLGILGAKRDCRRRTAHRRRGRAERGQSGDNPGLRRFFRRRGDQHRLLAREPQPGLGQEAAGSFRLREQRLRPGHQPGDPPEHHRRLGPGPGLRHSGGDRGRQRRAGRARGGDRGGSSGPRQGAGPTLLECKTYRWRGHHEGDPSQGLRYRSKEEIETWKEKCPIKRLADLIVKRKAASQTALDGIEKSLTGEIDAAVEFAKASPFPALDDMYEDVFVNRAGG